MLLLVTGSSCAGKTTAAEGCRDLPVVHVHDSDEHGVPSRADTAWRQSDLRSWVGRAVELQGTGEHLLLTSQSPLGELLAVPEADQLPVAACLLDVDDAVRAHRLESRDPGQWSDEVKAAFASWGRWHRRHAADPQYQPQVITDGGAPAMRWDRWTDWPAQHPDWSTHVIDTTNSAPAETREALRRWAIEAMRQALPIDR